MAKTVIALLGGVLIGILMTFATGRFGLPGDDPPTDVVRDLVDVPKMSQVVADKHREERYANLVSVEEVVALPTEFARAEALYALAGRNDSAGVQNLIFEANRIGDQIERDSSLRILFFRLAETDPQSALVLSRSDNFKAIKSIEETVWRAWARHDFEDALFEAKAQTSVAYKNSAAQSLYAAFGYLGNEVTDRIEAELGIGPDRTSRGGYLYQLADRSPAAAIEFINGLRRGNQHQQYVAWLAHYISAQDPNAALRYADLFESSEDVQYYRNIVTGNIAVKNPKQAVERMMANGSIRRISGEHHRAASELAKTDLATAKQFFEQARATDARRVLGSAITAELAKQDPLAALSWARANDTGRFPYLQMMALEVIGQTQPQLALTEALNTPNAQMRSNLVSNIVQRVAQVKPAEAMAYLDQIQNRRLNLEVREQIVSSWIRYDPEAAMDWVLKQDKETTAQIIGSATHRLVRSDIDAAIRLLPEMPEQNQSNMRQQIAQRLATDRSHDEAQNFIRQFEGQPGYDQLQADVISGVAKTDALLAKQLADQLAGNIARDKAYVQVIAQHARTNPTEAASWLRNVSDDRIRGQASSQLAARWYEHDPDAAESWVSGLPVGSSRDNAIVQMSHRWSTPTLKQERLIASIQDRGKRGQAKIRRIYSLMQTNPAKARKLLEDDDITDEQRQQLEMVIGEHGFGY